jgi:hypothetical protein
MVGAKGFEPSTSWSRTRRASQAALRPDTYGGNNPTSLSYRLRMRNPLGWRFFWRRRRASRYAECWAAVSATCRVSAAR